VRDQELDKVFRDKVAELSQYVERQEALKGIDHELSRHAYNITEKVREQGLRVLQLQELKALAIENEDYMAAKNLKAECERIKMNVQAIDPAKLFAPKSVDIEI
jgi:recombinational DNA repair ATPase RecF